MTNKDIEKVQIWASEFFGAREFHFECQLFCISELSIRNGHFLYSREDTKFH